MATTINELDWDEVKSELNREGYAVLRGLLAPSEARALAEQLHDTINSGSSLAELPSGIPLHMSFTLDKPLPESLSRLRNGCYQHLEELAISWAEIMGKASSEPASRVGKEEESEPNLGYGKLLVLGEQEYDVLAQNLETQFPIQLVMLLSEPGEDFTGGEFVMTEQRPRMQSRPIVVPMALGDVALIAVAHRPFRGSKGYYRVNSKHAVSRLHSGKRISVELNLDQSLVTNSFD